MNDLKVLHNAALPTIFNEIVSQVEQSTKILAINEIPGGAINADSLEEFCSGLGISSTELGDLLDGKYNKIYYVTDDIIYELPNIYRAANGSVVGVFGKPITLLYGIPNNPGDYTDVYIEIVASEDDTYHAYAFI